jgi:regulator of sirC expression with transglutaminase-like and TPR domain
MSLHARERFAELLAAGPDDFPLDEACLLVPAALGRPVDIDGSLDRLDRLAGEVLPPTLDGLLDGLFVSGRFRGNVSDYYNPANSYLDDVLDRGVGLPITLSVLAMEVGRRAGVPVWGVSMPGHFLVRDKVDPSVFADPFNGGLRLSAQQCRQMHQALTGGAAWDDDYLRPAARRTIVIRILTNLKGIAEQSGDLHRLLGVMKLRQVIPDLAEMERDEFRRLSARLN